MTAYTNGVNVPKPITLKRTVLVMKFFGKNGQSAPTLKEIVVNQHDYQTVLHQIRDLYTKAKLVHADLSEYNIFKFRKKIILFDFSPNFSLIAPHRLFLDISYLVLPIEQKIYQQVCTLFSQHGRILLLWTNFQ